MPSISRVCTLNDSFLLSILINKSLIVTFIANVCLYPKYPKIYEITKR